MFLDWRVLEHVTLFFFVEGGGGGFRNPVGPHRWLRVNRSRFRTAKGKLSRSERRGRRVGETENERPLPLSVPRLAFLPRFSYFRRLIDMRYGRRPLRFKRLRLSPVRLDVPSSARTTLWVNKSHPENKISLVTIWSGTCYFWGVWEHETRVQTPIRKTANSSNENKDILRGM